jgi:glycosyltransferase involved in cell wall biosynthesis
LGARIAAAPTVAGLRTLLVVENLSVPADRRVWQEALALTRAAMRVTVVCPQGIERDVDLYEHREGIEIHRYPLRAAGSAVGYVAEYATAFVRVAQLARRLARASRFDVVHVANPPDILLAAVWPLRRGGAALVLDHHDLAPELYQSRFGRGRDPVYLGLRTLERGNYALADVVIATNESYRELAISRGGKDPDDVIVVRNAPDLARLRRVDPDPGLARGKRHLLAYLGAMAPQDGVDQALRALAFLGERRDDWHAIFMGDGPSLVDLSQLSDELGLTDVVEFTGWADEDVFMPVLSSADVCLSPEPSSPLNDVSTMIKVAEYMAFGAPVVCYDLRESRATAADAALYAHPNDPRSYADAIDTLLNDDELRQRLGQTGERRVRERLSWESSERELLRAYERAIARRAG